MGQTVRQDIAGALRATTDDISYRRSRTMDDAAQVLPSDLAMFRDIHTDIFGVVPPLTAARFAIGASVDPDFLRLVEQMHTHVFYSDLFDAKILHLMAWGILLSCGDKPAQSHALAARRSGASWEELHFVAELACVVAGGLGPLSEGAALLAQLKDEERNRQEGHIGHGLDAGCATEA